MTRINPTNLQNVCCDNFHPRPARFGGFTLIELLVVIAIISLLVSILLPSLNRAKQLARTTICITNIRSNSIAIHFYASDHNGGLMPARDPDTGGFWFFRDWFKPYIDYTRDTANRTIANAHFMCPEWNGDEFDNEWYVSYTLNYTGQVSLTSEKDHSITWEEAEKTPFFLPLHAWESPSDELLLFDGRPHVYDRRQVPASFYWPTEGGNKEHLVDNFLREHYFPGSIILPYDEFDTGFRHPGKIAAGLFGDGHAEIVSRESVNRRMLDHEY